MKTLNEKVIREINQKMRCRIKPVNYLMDLLGIGKESAYRRLKNQIAFTLEEVSILAGDLDFSVDSLIEQDNKRHVCFDLIVNPTDQPVLIYENMLAYNNDLMKELNISKNLQITAAVNHLPLQYFPFEMLFKYEYYHYLHSGGNIPMSLPFSDLTISPGIAKLRENLIYNFAQIDNITCVLDRSSYERIFNGINYY
jgi:hypothetical protein